MDHFATIRVSKQRPSKWQPNSPRGAIASARALESDAFWRRRVFRIIPLLATVSVTLFAWACVNGSDQAQKTIVGAATSLLFVVNWVAANHVGAAGALVANWSVALEEQEWPVRVIHRDISR